MIKGLFNLFNKNKETKELVVNKKENTNDIKPENSKDTNETIDLLFNSEYFFILEIRNEKGKFVKYIQIVDDNNGNTPLVGLIFTDKYKAEKYIREDLIKLQKYNVKVVEIKIDNIFEYMNDLKNSTCEGIIINYPFDWTILKF